MAARPGTTRTFTVSFPHDLAEQVDHLAATESRTTSELFREAFRKYRAERIRTAFAEVQALAKQSGSAKYTSEEIEQFVDEIRTERQSTK